MREVTQTRTGYGSGNCTEAAIASLLGVELDVVPELWGGPSVPPDALPKEQQPKENCDRLFAWLREVHGVAWCEARFVDGLGDDKADVSVLFEHFTHLSIVSIFRTLFPHLDAPELRPWADPLIFFGPSATSRGVDHCVVGDGRGRVLWDPNPSRKGIVAVKGIMFLVPPADLPEDVGDMPAASWALTLK